MSEGESAHLKLMAEYGAAGKITTHKRTERQSQRGANLLHIQHSRGGRKTGGIARRRPKPNSQQKYYKF